MLAALLKPLGVCASYLNAKVLSVSSNKCLLSPPVVKTLSTLGNRAFAVAAPKLWNQLPSELRRITFIDHFKQALKTYLFKQAFY